MGNQTWTPQAIAEYEKVVRDFYRLKRKIDSISGTAVLRNTADSLVLDKGGGDSITIKRGVGGGTNPYRITAVSGSFPEWTYTAQRVISYNSALSGVAKWVTDGVNVTLKNRCEWTPASYPFTHGTGVTVADNTGAVATTFGGSTAGACIVRSIPVGAVVDVSVELDESNSAVYSFYAPNSAQAT